MPLEDKLKKRREKKKDRARRTTHKLPLVSHRNSFLTVSHTLSIVVSWLTATALRYKTEFRDRKKRMHRQNCSPQVSKENIKYKCSSSPMCFAPPFVGLC